MEDMAADAWRDARATGGAAPIRVLLRTGRDVVLNGLGARLEEVDGMGTLIRELGYTCRGLLRRPGFSLVAVVTLALGIGGNTAIYSIIDAAYIDALAYPDDEQLVVPYNVPAPEQGGGFAAFSSPVFAALRDQGAFASLAEIAPQPVNIGADDRPERVTGARVNGGFFEVAGVPPILGRGFTDDEGGPGGAPVAVISHGLWIRGFGGARDVAGRSVLINDQATVVVGVMPPDFTLLFEGVDVWLPTRVDEAAFTLTSAMNNNRILVGRVTGGADDDVRAGQLAAALDEVRARFPDALSDTHAIRLVSLREHLYGSSRTSLVTLLGAVGLVLMIACANLANLLLVRGESRRTELGVRAALGASRPQLIRILLTESLLLASMGAALGVAFAQAVLALVEPFAPPTLPMPTGGLDSSVLAFTAVVALATGLLFGLAPAWTGTRRDLRRSLVGGGRGSVTGRSRWTVRGTLVVVEVALTAVLLVSSGLLLDSLNRIGDVDPGFGLDDRTIAPLALGPVAYPDATSLNAFYRDLLDRLSASPDITAAGLGQFIPLTGASNWGFEVEGQDERGVGFSDYTLVTPGYFEAMGQHITRGRDLRWSDAEDGALPVLLVSEAMAAEMWPDADPIGRRINIDTDGRVWREVVGVVSDVRNRALAQEPSSLMYFPPTALPMSAPRGMSLVMHHPGAASPVALLRRTAESIDPTQPIDGIRSLDAVAQASESRRRFMMTLMGLFAGMALLLAAVGLYGVISYTFSLRRREIGLRMAVGAPRHAVLGLVLRRSGRLVAMGLLLGLSIAAVSSRLLESLLFEVGATDPTVYGVVALFLAAVAVAATWLPAARAARLDPATVLRG